VFASAEDALAAAREAYDGYLAATDAMIRDGGRSPERISAWVTPNHYAIDVEIAKGWATSGLHRSGGRKVTAFELESVAEDGNGTVEVNVNVCVDISGTRQLDSSGRDITEQQRTVLFPHEAQFVNLHPGDSRLVVANGQYWSGDDFCD
jgi:hypothetical protein